MVYLKIRITGSGTLEAQASTVTASSDLENIASGNLEAQASTVDATSERTIPSSGILEAQVSTVNGLAVDKQLVLEHSKHKYRLLMVYLKIS